MGVEPMHAGATIQCVNHFTTPAIKVDVRKSGRLKTGSSLISRAVSSQVLSAYGCLTSVFGMGTGGPPSYRRRIQLVQIFLCVVVGTRRSLWLRLRAFRLAQKNLSYAVYVKVFEPSKLNRRRNRAFKERKMLRILRNAV